MLLRCARRGLLVIDSASFMTGGCIVAMYKLALFSSVVAFDDVVRRGLDMVTNKGYPEDKEMGFTLTQ